MKNKFIFYVYLLLLKCSMPQEKSSPNNITNNMTIEKQPKKERNKASIFRLKMLKMAMQKSLQAEQISKNLNNNQEKQQKLILEKNENEKDYNDEEHKRLRSEQIKIRALKSELMWEELDKNYSDEERKKRKADRTKKRAERESFENKLAERKSFWEKLKELPLEERKRLIKERKKLRSEQRANAE